MKLNFKEYGEGNPLIILHGLFGSLDNWVTLGKKFGENNRVFLVDQRNHGQSPHSDVMTYEAMAEDLIDFINEQELEEVTVMGHSMGGKTAMIAALNRPDLIHRLIVVDMAPKSYPVHHRQILDGLLAMSSRKLTNRTDAEELLKPYIPEFGVRQFLLKNLYWKEKDELALRFNLEVLNRDIELLGTWDIKDVIYLGETHFIRGGKSNYIAKNDPSIFKFFPNAEIETIEDAGHWVHAEASEEFFEKVNSILIS